MSLIDRAANIYHWSIVLLLYIIVRTSHSGAARWVLAQSPAVDGGVLSRPRGLLQEARIQRRWFRGRCWALWEVDCLVGYAAVISTTSPPPHQYCLQQVCNDNKGCVIVHDHRTRDDYVHPHVICMLLGNFFSPGSLHSSVLCEDVISTLQIKLSLIKGWHHLSCVTSPRNDADVVENSCCCWWWWWKH